MKIKVTNKSNTVIGLVMKSPEGPKQKNLMPGEYITVEELTNQMRRLADPERSSLSIELMEV